MEKRLRQLGEQFDSQQTVEDIIQNKEKVSYYEGLFVLYDPFPCIESWKESLALIDENR